MRACWFGDTINKEINVVNYMGGDGWGRSEDLYFQNVTDNIGGHTCLESAAVGPSFPVSQVGMAPKGPEIRCPSALGLASRAPGLAAPSKEQLICFLQCIGQISSHST